MAAVGFDNIADMKRQPGLSGLPQPMRAGMEGAMPATSKREEAKPKRRHKVKFPVPSKKNGKTS
jgi:hypothetical protein